MHDYQIPEIGIHATDIDVIDSLVTPMQDHLSTALDLLWSSIIPGACGRNSRQAVQSSRKAISAVLHFWFAAETAVNTALYHKLKNEKSPYFLKPEDRKAFDREIAKEMGRLSFDKRIQYLKDTKDCCTNLDGFVGKLRQYERLRNAIVHGYVYQKEILLGSAGPSTVTKQGNQTTVMTPMRVEDEAYSQGGKAIDPLTEFKELNLRHHLSALCCHDAMTCAWISFGLLSWLDSHYGIVANASWAADETAYHFVGRAGLEKSFFPTKSNTTRIEGFSELLAQINLRARSAKSSSTINAILKAKQQKSAQQKGPKRQKQRVKRRTP